MSNAARDVADVPGFCGADTPGTGGVPGDNSGGGTGRAKGDCGAVLKAGGVTTVFASVPELLKSDGGGDIIPWAGL